MKEKFEYKYTAPSIDERTEIDNIRKKYLPAAETNNKLERLRKLDNKVRSVPQAICLSVGVIGILFFGLGMSLFLEITDFWYLGIPSSIIGIVMIATAYPLYKKIYLTFKKKYSKEIIRLSDELLNENNNEKNV